MQSCPSDNIIKEKAAISYTGIPEPCRPQHLFHPAETRKKGIFIYEYRYTLFFDTHTDALPLYQALESRILQEIENVSIKVQKTQISFYNRHMFACVSFTRLRRKKDCPPVYLTVTFGLDHKAESPRIEIATEPYPNRWTHHLFVTAPEEVDDQLMQWIKEAADFSAVK